MVATMEGSGELRLLGQELLVDEYTKIAKLPKLPQLLWDVGGRPQPPPAAFVRALLTI